MCDFLVYTVISKKKNLTKIRPNWTPSKGVDERLWSRLDSFLIRFYCKASYRVRRNLYLKMLFLFIVESQVIHFIVNSHLGIGMSQTTSDTGFERFVFLSFDFQHISLFLSMKFIGAAELIADETKQPFEVQRRIFPFKENESKEMEGY